MIDLPALRDLLVAKGSPLVLAADDDTLPEQVRSFLAGAPGTRLTLDPAAGGIHLDGDTLTVAGTCADTWPVEGLSGVTVTLGAATLAVTNADQTSTVAATATGTVPLGGAPVAVTLASTVLAQQSGWTVTLAGNTPGLRATDLLAFGQGGVSIGPPVPAGLDVLDSAVTVAPAGFVVTFFPHTGFDPWIAVALSVPGARWQILDGVLDVDGLDVNMFLSPGGYSLALTGHLKVDGIGVDVGVGLSDDPQWTAFVRPSDGTTFPGLAALAGWLIGGGSGAEATSSFQSVGFDTSAFDLAIASVRFGFDWQRRTLDYLDVVSLLSIRALELDVAVRLPDLSITGTLHDAAPVNVAAVLGSFGLPTAGVPAALTLSEADFSAQPTLGLYSIDLTLDEVWTIGPLDVARLTLAIARDPVAGFTGSVDGVITVGPSVQLVLGAAYQDAATGWAFTGGTVGATGLAVGDLVAMLADKFGITAVPQALRSLSLTDVTISYQTGTGAFSFTCEGDFTVLDTAVTLAIDITLTPKADGGYTSDFSGRLTVGALVFGIVFELSGEQGDIFVATYHHTGDATATSLHDLVAGISPAAAQLVPQELSIGLSDVKFLYSKPIDATDATFALGLDLSARIGLSQLPLIGDQLPADAALAVENLQLLYSSGPVDPGTVKVANRLFGDGVMALPSDGLNAGVAVTTELRLGDDRQTLRLGVPSTQPSPTQPPPTQPSPAQRAQARPAPGRSAEPAPAAVAEAGSSPGISKWFTVQRTVGPLSINRVGILLQGNALLLGLDAGLTLGPLGISLDGLAVGSTLTAFHPVFDLAGLGLDYTTGPLHISGALRRVPEADLPSGTTLQFDGSALVQAETFGLAAIGSWAQLTDGQPSLFVFAQYDEPLGGPPAFFVTGLMAGFGYNRSLALPAQDEVGAFPLLLLNQPGGGNPPSAETVLAVLEGRSPAPGGGKARQWIAPRPGSDWLAVGVVFTSFELVRSRALLVAEFGDELTFALLGTSTLQLPMPEESTQPYAYVELDLEAVLKPAEGFFGLTALLAPTSFVLDRACHLTGGFAMYTWFGDNPNAGQFVVTLGGYHPAFVPPPYYPAVPRLGFNWAVSDTVSIAGSAYLALTPSCAMAGAALDVEFHDGDLRAWFTASADVLISWRPFFFTADIAVGIGVSYRLNLLFCYKTISLSLGARLEMWGPPTGGRVHIDLWIVSFTVGFGAGQPSAADKPLGWSEFRSLLPDTGAVTITATGGVAATVDSPHSTSGKAWRVRARGFGFTTQSAVPASQLRYGDTKVTASADGTHNHDGAPINVRPMNLADVAGVHRLTVRQGGADGPVAPLAGWTLTPRAATLPESLWAAPPKPFTQIPARPSAEVLTGQLVGYDVTAQEPAVGPTRGVFPIEELAQTQLPPGVLPLRDPPVPDPGYAPVADATTVGLLAGIAAAAPRRTALRDALADAGAYKGGAGTLSRLAADAQHLFTDPPMREGQDDHASR
jgi:hypothetical protein